MQPMNRSSQKSRDHDITDPAVNIEYILPLAEVPRAEADIVTGADVGYPYTTIAMFILLAAGSGLLIFLLRSRSVSVKPADTHRAS